MEEARRRFEAAYSANDDVATNEAIVLAINTAVAHEVYADWVHEAVTNAPTIRGLASSMPYVPDGPAISDAAALVQWVHALDAPKNSQAEQSLREIYNGPAAVAPSAGRWLAYHLRDTHRYEESLEVFEDLIQRDSRRHHLYRHQYSITLQSMRRFEDMINYRETHGIEPIVRDSVKARHGVDTRSLMGELSRASKSKSRRYGFQVEANAWVIEARFRQVPRQVVKNLAERAVLLNAPLRESDTWVIRGYASLYNEAAFERAVSEVIRLGQIQSPLPRASVTRLLAMRALVTGTTEDADRAWRSAQDANFLRPSSWIFTEFAMELIDRKLPEVSAQWLEPLDVVRERWYGIIRDIIARSEAGQILV